MLNDKISQKHVCLPVVDQQLVGNSKTLCQTVDFVNLEKAGFSDEHNRDYPETCELSLRLDRKRQPDC